jgi:hypothetical protein
MGPMIKALDEFVTQKNIVKAIGHRRNIQD